MGDTIAKLEHTMGYWNHGYRLTVRKNSLPEAVCKIPDP